ncbi:MAG: sensor histidine kinase [Paracoccaceae bacterium]
MFWSVTFLSTVLVLGMIHRATVALLDAEARGAVETELRGLADVAALGGGRARARAIERRSVEGRTQSRVYLLAAPDGTRLAGNLASWPAGAETGPLPVATTARLELQRTDTGRVATVHAMAVRLRGGARLLVGRDAAAEARSRAALGEALALGLAIATVVAAGTGWALLGGVLARMGAMRETAQAIVSGDLSRRVPLAGADDEFDQLAQTLNRMIARLESQMHALGFAAESMAHDLRTPVTRLRLHLETLRDGGDAPKAVARALAEADRVERVLATLLAIARARAGVGRAQMAPVDLAELAADVAELFEPAAEAHDVTLALEAPAAAVTRGQRDLLFLALSNLIENALAAVPSGGRIAVAASDDGAAATLAVTDTGPGLPEPVRRRLAGEGGAGDGPSRGLGLALVQAVARMHDGALVLDEARPGLRARLALPSLGT